MQPDAKAIPAFWETAASAIAAAAEAEQVVAKGDNVQRTLLRPKPTAVSADLPKWGAGLAAAAAGRRSGGEPPAVAGAAQAEVGTPAAWGAQEQTVQAPPAAETEGLQADAGLPPVCAGWQVWDAQRAAPLEQQGAVATRTAAAVLPPSPAAAAAAAGSRPAPPPGTAAADAAAALPRRGGAVRAPAGFAHSAS